jgi:hypothetical protein
MAKKQWNARLSEETILAIKIRAKELGCSEAEAVERAFAVAAKGRTPDFDYSGPIVVPHPPANKREIFEMLKAGLSGNRGSMSSFSAHSEVPELQNVPTAPFDFNDEEGNPHRVRAYGKFLKVCFLRDGVEEPLRNLREGELETLWQKRIQ